MWCLVVVDLFCLENGTLNKFFLKFASESDSSSIAEYQIPSGYGTRSPVDQKSADFWAGLWPNRAQNSRRRLRKAQRCKVVY